MNSTTSWKRPQVCDNCGKETNRFIARAWIGLKEIGRLKDRDYLENYAGATYNKVSYRVTYSNIQPLLVITCDDCYNKRKKAKWPSEDKEIQRYFAMNKIIANKLDMDTTGSKVEYGKAFKDENKFNELIQTRPEYLDILRQSILIEGMRNRWVDIVNIEQIHWPDACVVCGSNEAINYETQTVLSTKPEEKVSIPVCKKHLNMSKKGSTLVISILILIFIVGVFSLFMKMPLILHIGVCFGGLPLVLIALLWILRVLLNKTLIGRFANMIDDPLKGIDKHKNYYTIKFHNNNIAEMVADLNQDNLYMEWDVNQILNRTSY